MKEIPEADVPEESNLAGQFMDLIYKAVSLWQEKDLRTSRGTKLQFLSFLYENECIKEVMKLAIFQTMVEELKREIVYYEDMIHEKRPIVEALKDYLLVAGRPDHDQANYFDEPAGQDEAIRLLLEDTYLRIPPNRGFVWISGIQPTFFVSQINEKIRIRRATRFELRAMELESRNPFWDWELPERALLPAFLPAVQSAYMIEIEMEPDSVPDIGEMRNNPPSTATVENLLSCFRLLWDSPFSLDSSFFLTQTESHHTSARQQIRREFTHSHEMLKFIDGHEHPTFRHRSKLVYGSIEHRRLAGFWKEYCAFRNDPRGEVHRDFERALLRYNQSFTEIYAEDVTLDLALALEALIRTGGQPLSYLAATLSAPDSDISLIQNLLSKFILLRNRVAHGTTITPEDFDIVRPIEQIVRACIRHVVFLAPLILDERRGLRTMLDSCVMDCSKRNELAERIPDWSRKP